MKVTPRSRNRVTKTPDARTLISLLRTASPAVKKIAKFAMQTKRSHPRDFKRNNGSMSSRTDSRPRSTVTNAYRAGRSSHFHKDLKNDVPKALQENPIQRIITNQKNFIDDGGNAQRTKEMYQFMNRVNVLELFTQEKLYRSQDANGPTFSGSGLDFADKLWIDFLEYEIYLTNSCALPVEVDMYLVHPKEDTSVSPDTAFSIGLSNDNATNSVITPTENTWGYYLNYSTQFKDIYAIDYHEKIVMDSGGTHKHTGKIDIHKYVHYQDVVQSVEAFMNKLTKVFMLQAKAFPVHVDGDPSTAEVSACPFRIDSLIHYQYKFRRCNLPKKKDKITQNSITILPGPYAYQQKDADPQPTGTGEV